MSSLKQHPAPGEHTIHFRGDTVTFTLENHGGEKGKAWLRSNIGYAHVRHREIINHAEQGLPPLSRDWHDFPMEAVDKTTFTLTLPLLGVGRFAAKAFFIADGTDTCQICGAGTYLGGPPEAPAATCTDCPDDSTTAGTGSTVVTACECEAGFTGDIQAPADTCAACSQAICQKKVRS